LAKKKFPLELVWWSLEGNLLVTNIVTSEWVEFTVPVLLLGECDLVEDEGGDFVGEGRGNGKGRGLRLVAAQGAGDELKLEGGTVGVGEADGSLLFNGTVVGGADAGLGANDAVAGLEVDAVAARLVGMDDVFTENGGELVRALLRSSGGEGQEGECDDDLHGEV